jgi:hypothetical protein
MYTPQVDIRLNVKYSVCRCVVSDLKKSYNMHISGILFNCASLKPPI